MRSPRERRRGLAFGPFRVSRGLADGADRRPDVTKKAVPMLETVIVLFFVLWLLGFISGTLGGFIHVLLVIALIALVFRLVGGRRVT
jgi:hypothetical protein